MEEDDSTPTDADALTYSLWTVVTPDGSVLASTLHDKAYRVWDRTPNGAYLASYDGYAMTLAVSVVPTAGHRRTGRAARTVLVLAAFSSLALGTGDFVFARSVTSPGDDTFVLVDAVGREVESFSPSMVAEPDLERGVASPRPGTEASFWAASIWRYTVHEWSARGEFDRSLALERTLVREADWFPAYPEFGAEVYETAPPPAFLHHIWEDDEGLLWVYALLPDADLRPPGRGGRSVLGPPRRRRRARRPALSRVRQQSSCTR